MIATQAANLLGNETLAVRSLANLAIENYSDDVVRVVSS